MRNPKNRPDRDATRELKIARLIRMQPDTGLGRARLRKLRKWVDRNLPAETAEKIARST